MGDVSVFDEIPEEISQHLVNFSEALDELDTLVGGIVSQENEQEIEVPQQSPMELIKRDLSLCYTYNAAFFMYLRCNGIDTRSHPVMQELNRVMTALKRCRTLTEKKSAPKMRCDKEAASRFIKHALWQSAQSKTKKRKSTAHGSHSK